MPHGGKRPGAGAPKGNLNALKTGANSVCLQGMLAAMEKVPEMQAFMLEVKRRQARHQQRASRLIRKAMLELMQDVTTKHGTLELEDNQVIAYLLATNGLAGKNKKRFLSIKLKESNQVRPSCGIVTERLWSAKNGVP